MAESCFRESSFASCARSRETDPSQGLELLGVNQASDDPTAALTGPSFPVFLLGYFQFFLVIHDRSEAVNSGGRMVHTEQMEF